MKKLLYLWAFLGLISSQLTAKDSLRIGLLNTSKHSILNDVKQRNDSLISTIAQQNKQSIQTKYYDTPNDYIAALKNHEIDLALNDFIMSFDRISDSIYYSVPYHHSKFILAGKYVQKENLWDRVSLPENVLYFFMILISLFLLFGTVIWWIEHGKDKNIHENFFPGLFDGVYQAFNVVMKLNVDQTRILNSSFITRLFSIPIWIVSIFLISILVGQINKDVINLNKKTHLVQDLDGLQDKPTAYLVGTLAEDFAKMLVQDGFIGPKQLRPCQNYTQLIAEINSQKDQYYIMLDRILDEATQKGLINKKAYTKHELVFKENNVAVAYNYDFFLTHQALIKKINLQLYPRY
jgi:Bacterial extracellular solute-binding proteins, family 3